MTLSADDRELLREKFSEVIDCVATTADAMVKVAEAFDKARASLESLSAVANAWADHHGLTRELAREAQEGEGADGNRKEG